MPRCTPNLACRGLFNAQGVRPVHQDAYPGEGGIKFDFVTELRVVVHDRRFSPCNANVRLASPAPPVASFFSLAIDKQTHRAVVAYHVLPIGDPPADAIRVWMRGRSTLGSLVEGVDEHLSGDPARFLRAMLAPLLPATAAAAVSGPPTSAPPDGSPEVVPAGGVVGAASSAAGSACASSSTAPAAAPSSEGIAAGISSATVLPEPPPPASAAAAAAAAPPTSAPSVARSPSTEGMETD